MAYKVIVPKPVQKAISKLAPEIQPRINVEIGLLANIPRPVGVKKMKGRDSEYRIRIGAYRIRYEIDDTEKVVRLIQCQHRSSIYKDKR